MIEHPVFKPGTPVWFGSGDPTAGPALHYGIIKSADLTTGTVVVMLQSTMRATLVRVPFEKLANNPQTAIDLFVSITEEVMWQDAKRIMSNIIGGEGNTDA